MDPLPSCPYVFVKASKTNTAEVLMSLFNLFHIELSFVLPLVCCAVPLGTGSSCTIRCLHFNCILFNLNLALAASLSAAFLDFSSAFCFCSCSLCIFFNSLSIFLFYLNLFLFLFLFFQKMQAFITSEDRAHPVLESV